VTRPPGKRGAGWPRPRPAGASPGDARTQLAGPGANGTQRRAPAVVPPAALGLRDDLPLPIGTTVHLEDDTQEIAPGVLFGGSPARVMRLSPAGVTALAELRAGPVTSAAGAVLARRLTDTGLAQPRVPRPSFRQEGPVAALPAVDDPAVEPAVDKPAVEPAADKPSAAEPGGPTVTVVVPVRDRSAELDRCLAAAGRRYPVVVVDDGSADPAALAAVCAANGAGLIRREVNGGPAAARNTGLRAVTTEFVAFLDSDCVPAADWIADLAGHFADPLVAAVAPRIVAAPSAGSTTAGRSVLDLGDRPARVAPMTRVAYVPTAALLVRRAALGDGFDEALRYGEDVDLVWRLVAAGWRVRYDPGVRIGHAEPASRPELLHRRFEYGRSAAPLTRRHPGAVAPLVLQPWPTITMAALLARRPVTAAAAFGLSTALLAGRLRDNGLPASGLAKPMANGVRQTWLGTGRWCGQFAAPVLLAAVARPGGRTARTRWGRRLAVASLLAGPPLTEWAAQSDAGGRPGPVRFTARALADQAAYGAGVYAGCLRERMISPLLPAVSVKPFEGLRRRRGLRTGPLA
jgi:mycofactocin system glycosyltransferase